MILGAGVHCFEHFSRSCFVISSFIVFYWLDMEMKIGENGSVWGEGARLFSLFSTIS
jgi:hypothetical protein